MKTILEYLINNHIISKYKNPNWKQWRWGNKQVSSSIHAIVSKFINNRYGDTSPQSFIKLLEDYYSDYIHIMRPKCDAERETKSEIMSIKVDIDKYNDIYKPSVGQGFISFIYDNCIK